LTALLVWMSLGVPWNCWIPLRLLQKTSFKKWRYVKLSLLLILILEFITDTLTLIGRNYRFTYAGQGIGAVEKAPESHLAVRWIQVHYSVLQTQLRNLRIVGGSLRVIRYGGSKALERILFDIRERLMANHHVANYDVINRRLDLFVQEFEVTLTFLHKYIFWYLELSNYRKKWISIQPG